MKSAKLLRRILLFVALVVLIVVVVVLFSIDGIIRSAVQTETTAALGCKTTLSDASLSIFAGKLGLNGLTIANPPGFAHPDLLTMQGCGVAVSVHSLLTSTVDIKTITVSGLSLWIDQSGLNNNVLNVLDYIKKHQKTTSSSTSSSSSSSGSTGKQLQIGKILLTKLHVYAPDGIDIALKEIQINQPTNPNGRPLRLAGLIRQVLTQVVAAAVHSGKLPTGLATSLGAANQLLQGNGGGLQQKGKQLIGGVNSSLQKLLGGKKNP